MHKMVEYLNGAAVVKAKAELSSEGCQELVAEYQRLNAEIAALRSSLSTARAEGKREGLEEAAQYHDDLEAQHAAAHRDVESDHHMMMERHHRRHATALRAKMEETKL